jgi:hypothetical protein
MGLTLDTGALVAIDKGSREVWALLKAAHQEGLLLTVEAAALAQAWRSDSVQIAGVLKFSACQSLTPERARRVGVLLGQTKTRDIVDATVALGAIDRGDAIVTSDPDDLEALVGNRGLRGKSRIIRI